MLSDGGIIHLLMWTHSTLALLRNAFLINVDLSTFMTFPDPLAPSFDIIMY